ncbi:D-alanyl-D-alanine carboxypeptidase, penicillin-binding protein 5 [Catenovulum agarivorans DS-2]|uniref:serine-type D-Ala-D-Ala carboxypeptidase n=1 Tax=Catenovulum agarivorans DS-2 TaxID=1328313 RepID=W7QHC2_9ALTE|nr:serine hydrolase [Catenovulum agarivorans]EWH08352.1 D-alanyl-D-alanine carboxypeptidase, penicillin-binding protein 5 [Catenovulum agarivorans DS-2]
MKKIIKRTIGILSIGVSLVAFNASAILPSPPKVNAKGHILIDYHTGYVISSDNADMQLAPASLTKMMTSYVIGLELKNGNIKNSDLVTISEKAWAKNFPESSKMFIEVGKQVSVEDLNRGIIIQSGNDACVAMAEHIAGTEGAFVSLMNAHAEKLGMTASYFENSHGLTAPNHFTSPRDMATLAKALIRDTPDEYALYAEKSFTFNGIKQYNRNTLLWDKSLDVDGIKTGHTQEAGYSLVTSATKGDMRLISVVMGADSERARKDENKKLLNYGFRFFETITPYDAGTKFADQPIWMGDKDTVRLGITQSTQITIPRGQRKNLKTNIQLDQELVAPVKKGTVVGKLFLQLDGEDLAEYPLVALESINEGGLMSRAVDYLKMQFK